MTKLRTIQQDFMANFLRGEPQITDHIVGANSEYKQIRLNVYREGFVIRLQEILHDDFPALKHYIGENKFSTYCQNYIKAYPPTSYTVRDFPSHFPDFLKLVSTDPIVFQFARYEWAFSLLVDSADAPYLTSEQIGHIAPADWPYLQITPHPSVQLFKFSQAIPEYRFALDESQSDIQLQHYTGDEPYLIWRYQNVECCYVRLTTDGAKAFELFAAGLTFAEVAEQFVGEMPDERIAPFIVECLQFWLTEGILSEFCIANPKT